MGATATATLFWGVDLGNLTDSDTYETWAPAWMLGEDGYPSEWDPSDMLATKHGWDPDVAPFPDHLFELSPSGRAPWSAEGTNTSEYRAWSANLERQRRILQALDLGCEFGWYGSLEWSSDDLYVAVTASKVDAKWECKALDVDIHGDEGMFWQRTLTRYLELCEIPLDRAGPMGWHLTVSYG